MKRNAKNKKPIKENQKISNFFTKLVNGRTNTECQSSQHSSNTQVDCLGDSDDDFVASTSKFHTVPKPPSTPISIKQKSFGIVKALTPVKEDVIIKPSIRNVIEKDEDTIKPSTSSKSLSSKENIIKTPPAECKKRTRDATTPTSPDVIPCSLKPKEQSKLKNLSIYFDKVPAKKKKKQPPSEMIEENLSNLPKNVLKHFQSPSKNDSDLKILSRAKSKTPPSKKKVSPTKLFNKSPRSLRQFNVEVLKNFVTVTPSKSNIKDEKGSPVSARSVEVQRVNESTPTKDNESVIPRQIDAVRTKLKFDSMEDVKINLLNDSWDGELDSLGCFDHSLDLTGSKHCKLLEVRESYGNVEVVLQCTKSANTAQCIIEGFWVQMKLVINDIVHVTAVFDDLRSVWCVSNEHGLIVFEPDFLVSTTSVVGALFCRRRSVLSERYRGFEPSNRVMIVGILVHKLLQEVLKANITMFSEIEVTMKKLLLEKETVWMFYESNLDNDDVEKELTQFIPRIVSFMKEYILQSGGEQRQVKKEDWSGKIDSIQDIEENIWCPELGVKGKVDVSIQSGQTIMPLELKTGRATISLEHRGQVMLYIMMMEKLGYDVPSGLLLYLREGVLREIPITRQEMRDIIILRNELTYYLTRKPFVDSEIRHAELPLPINHHNACAKCPYNIICSAYLTVEKVSLLNNPLESLHKEVLAHLDPTHLKYFIEWSSLVTLEASSNVGNKDLREIYTLPPEEREKNGQCIINMEIKGAVSEYRGLYKHSFTKITKSFNLVSGGIGVGNYVVVSTDTRPAVAAGFATHIDFDCITISLDRDLTVKYRKGPFHLDTYNSSTSQTFNLTNLALLLEASERSKRLREIIVDRAPPTFQGKLPKAVATKGTPILRTLNKMQQKAALKTLCTNDYLLIKGMPGTGKTATIVALIRLLVELEKTVLITSHTHAAVDNVCVRLQVHGIPVLRLGAEAKIDSRLRSCSEQSLTQHCVTPEQLEEVYEGAAVLAVTCLGSGHSVLNKRQIDVCIVDESTQVLQCSIFRALYAAQKFVLIGDPCQLPPIVRNREAISRGLGESLFERLDNPASTVTLNLNYRMNAPITAMANALTYKGELLVGNEDVGNATLRLPLKKELLASYDENSWILQVLNEELAASVQIIDTGSIWSRLPSEEATKCTNMYETAVVVTVVNALLKGGVRNDTIGIIAPYRAQVSQICLALAGTEIEISTVDQFQGRDKDVVLYSCTKSRDPYKIAPTEFEILNDHRRLTVAVTRAKHKFILIGDLATIKQYSPFVKLLKCLSDSCFVKLEDGQKGFYWEEIVNVLR